MPETYTRSAWGARPAGAGGASTPLVAGEVRGVALHWPGITRPLTTTSAVMRSLRGWQALHMDGRGWSDIAYQEAIDQDGNVYILRGLGFRSAANGDTATNRTFGALLLVLAAGEQPTLAMREAVQRRVAAFRRRYPAGTRIVGHRQVRPEPTACPGPIVTNLINRGVFVPPTHQEDEMARYTDWPAEDRRAMARDVVDELLTRDLFGAKPDKDRSVAQVLRSLDRRLEEIERRENT